MFKPMRISLCVLCVFAAFVLAGTTLAGADVANPRSDGSGTFAVRAPSVPGLTAYTDHAAWAADVGTATLIDFESFADGTMITTQLSRYGVELVHGVSEHEVPPGPTSQYVTASTSLSLPIFTSGTLPSEPNFLSNDLSYPNGAAATGKITFDLSRRTTAIGAFIADGATLGDFNIEVSSHGDVVGTITVSARRLPDSFIGVVSTVPFDRATFYASDPDDSWGLDNLEIKGKLPRFGARDQEEHVD